MPRLSVGTPSSLAQRRSLHTGGPQGDRGVDALTAGDDVAGLHIGDAQTGVDFNTERSELLLGFDGELLRVRQGRASRLR